MLREDFGLGLHHRGKMGFERFGDPRVQLLASASEQAAVRRVLNQRVLETVNRVGRCAALKHQLGGDEAAESGLQLALVKTGNDASSVYENSRPIAAPICATHPSDRDGPSANHATWSGLPMAAVPYPAHTGSPPCAVARSLGPSWSIPRQTAAHRRCAQRE